MKFLENAVYFLRFNDDNKIISMIARLKQTFLNFCTIKSDVLYKLGEMSSVYVAEFFTRIGHNDFDIRSILNVVEEICKNFKFIVEFTQYEWRNNSVCRLLIGCFL